MHKFRAPQNCPRCCCTLNTPSMWFCYWHAAGLLLSALCAVQEISIDLARSRNDAAALRSAANAGSILLTAKLTRLSTDLLLLQCCRTVVCYNFAVDLICR